MKTKLPSGVRSLWEDPDKEEILASMPEFSQWGLGGRDDHRPQRDKTRKAKLPSSPEEEPDELEYESVEGDGDGAGGDSSGSEDDGDNDDDGSDNSNE